MIANNINNDKMIGVRYLIFIVNFNLILIK